MGFGDGTLFVAFVLDSVDSGGDFSYTGIQWSSVYATAGYGFPPFRLIYIMTSIYCIFSSNFLPPPPAHSHTASSLLEGL